MKPALSRPTMLAGWLFADLFLVLVLIGLAAIPVKSATLPDPSQPYATSTPTPQPTPTHPIGLDPDYVEFGINLSPQAFRNGARDQLLRLVNTELSRRDPTRRQVGFVLVFASDDAAHVGRAVDTATDVVNLLRDRLPAFAHASGLGYWNGENNDFEFKIFLLN